MNPDLENQQYVKIRKKKLEIENFLLLSIQGTLYLEKGIIE